MQARNVLRGCEDRYQRLRVRLVGVVRAGDRRYLRLTEVFGIEGVRTEFCALAPVLVPNRQFHLAGRQFEQVAAEIGGQVALGIHRLRLRQMSDVLPSRQTWGTVAEDVQRRAR